MILAIAINVLVIITGIAGAVVAAPGMGGFSAAGTVGFINGAWALFFFSLSLIVFGVIGVMCELSAIITIKFYLQAMGLFARYWTRAVWYLVLGFLALGVAGSFGVASAICCWILSVFLILLEVLVRTNTI